MIKKSMPPKITFKIYICNDSKNVVLNGDFKKYSTYNELENKLRENSQNSLFKQENLNLKTDEKFKIVYLEDKENDLYFPKELPGEIWNNDTYEYLKDKLLLYGTEDIKYKFYLQRVDDKELPKWVRKDNSQILEEALNKYWGEIFNDITTSLSLFKLEKSKDNSLKESKKNQIIENNNEKHNKVICSNCFNKEFEGKRFMCSECKNYNLCETCEKKLKEKEIHNREHTFIQIKKPIEMDDFFKYNNVIGYCQEINDFSTDYFKFNINVINNGEIDLKDCYILPIRYGNEYLTCEPKNISVTKGMSIKITLNLEKPENSIGMLRGYFRMFTPNGIPFGNVINIKLKDN